MKKVIFILLGVAAMGFAYSPYSFRYASTAGILWDDYDWFLNDPARIPLIEGYRLYTNLANFVSGDERFFSDSAALQTPGFVLLGGKAFGPPLGAAGVFDTRMTRVADETGIGGYLGYGSSIDTSYQVDPENGSITGRTITAQASEAYHKSNNFDGFFGLGYQLNEAFNLGFGYDHSSYWGDSLPADRNQITATRNYDASDLVSFDTLYSAGRLQTREMSNRIRAGALTLFDYFQLSGYLGAETFTGDRGRDTLYSYQLSESYGAAGSSTINRQTDVENWRYSGFAFPVELLGIYELDEGQELWFTGGFEYNFWRWKDGAGVSLVGTDTSLASTGTGTEATINIDSTLTAGSGSGSGMAYHLGTKGVFDLNDKVSFGLGILLHGSSDKDSTLGESSAVAYENYDNGDGSSGVEDYVTTIQSDSSAYLLNKVSNIGFNIPVGVELRPVKFLALRLGAVYSYLIRTYTTRTYGIGTMSTHTHTDFGDGTSMDTTIYTNYGTGDSEGSQKETVNNVVFDLGLGFNITDNIQLDLMGFTNLLDMNNWRISLVFKF